MNNTEIVIIDDSFEMFDPLVVELREHFPAANVTIKNNPDEGLRKSLYCWIITSKQDSQKDMIFC